MLSADRFATPVRMRVAPVMSPAGSASASAAMASAISCMEMSWRMSAIMGVSTMVSGAASPRIVVRVTPTSKSRPVNSSAKRPSCSTPTGPVMTTSVTLSLQALRLTFGSSASSGRFVTVSTADCTSAAARAMSQPGSKSSRIEARPSRAVELDSTTPSTAMIVGSRIWMMPLSTSSAPAPSQVTETVTLSTITSGKNWARMFGKDTKPSVTRTTRRRFAAVR